MHLAGEADAGDIVRPSPSPLNCFGYGDAAGAPPVFGMLLSPANVRRGKWGVLLSGGTGDSALLIKNQCACPAGSNINAQSENDLSPC
jgi:hypothetical protein